VLFYPLHSDEEIFPRRVGVSHMVMQQTLYKTQLLYC
jgi:hypothetical protein